MNACMGGFCAKRDQCANYHAGRVGLPAFERLCRPGDEGHPPAAGRTAGENLQQRMVAWLDEHPRDTMHTADFAVKFGVSCDAVRARMSQAARAGEVEREIGGGKGHPTTYRSTKVNHLLEAAA